MAKGQAWAAADAGFDLPPRVAIRIERRLAGRAVTLWSALRRGRRLPDPVAFAAALGVDDDFGDNSVRLDCTAPLVVVAAGRAVAAAFAVAPGPLRPRDPQRPLDPSLATACAGFAVAPVPASFEGVFASPTGAATRLLARGVVLPLGDAVDRVVAAHAVIAWQEVLSPAASDRLMAELNGARPPAFPPRATALPFPPRPH